MWKKSFAFFFFFSSRRRHTRLQGDWSSDVCSSDLDEVNRPGRRIVAISNTTTARSARRTAPHRSEERRVGKECRSRWSPDHEKKNAQWESKKLTQELGDRIFGEIAAAMRRGDEDDPAHIWQWLDEHGSAQKITPFGRQADLVDRLVGDGLPNPVTGIDDHCLGKETALAVANDDHLRQRRVGTRRVELVHRLAKRLAQQRRRIEDGVAGIVGEEPELVAIADPRVIQQIIDHVAPPPSARGGSVDKYDRYPPGPIGVNRGEVGRRRFREHTGEKCLELALPDLR